MIDVARRSCIYLPLSEFVIFWALQIRTNDFCHTQQNPADIGAKPLTAKRIQLLVYILNFRKYDQRIGEEEYRQYSAAAVIRRLEKSFSRKGFFTAAVFAALTQRSEGMRHTLSKQETCKGAAAAMAETAAWKQASCSITLDSQFSMQLTTDEFSTHL